MLRVCGPVSARDIARPCAVDLTSCFGSHAKKRRLSVEENSAAHFCNLGRKQTSILFYQRPEVSEMQRLRNGSEHKLKLVFTRLVASGYDLICWGCNCLSGCTCLRARVCDIYSFWTRIGTFVAISLADQRVSYGLDGLKTKLENTHIN